eukprot:COSAG01_NODE_58294_length_307_cov_0.456731_1_plen_65_part_00
MGGEDDEMQSLKGEEQLDKDGRGRLEAEEEAAAVAGEEERVEQGGLFEDLSFLMIRRPPRSTRL